MNNIICLWSCPRNVSTALMYSFAQRGDTRVFDEVLYAHYLSESKAEHPGRKEVLASQENDGKKVIENIILQKRSKISFHKLMTHFLINLNTNFLKKVQNIIFIRNPEEIICSYHKVVSNPTMEDIGIKKQYEVYHNLIKMGQAPIVLDSKYLLQNPQKILKKLCLLLNIAFDKGMLQWKKGARKEDGIWAKYWYKNVHNSSSFLPYSKKASILNASNVALAQKCKPYYEFLTSKSIKV
ncbi:sulfotransferase family protein [Flavobacteriales bacterium]|nr:sulfotransferase family protein [Flavobacteriales bacterium]